MQANNFEKGIQQQLEGFTVVPNEDVWLKVEARIKNEKKRRRVFIFWLFAALLVCSGGIFWLSNHINGSEQANTHTGVQPNIPAGGAHENPAQAHPGALPAQKEALNKANAPATSVNTGQAEIDPLPVPRAPASVRPISSPTAMPASNTPVGRTKSAIAAQSPHLTEPSLSHNTTGVSDLVHKPTNTTNAAPGVQSNPILNGRNSADTLENKPLTTPASLAPGEELSANEAIPAMPDGVRRNADSSKLPLVRKPAGKWKFGFSLLAGLTDNVAGLKLGANAQGLYAADRTPPSSPVSSAVIARPLTYESRLGWSAGVFAEKRISKAWKLSGGLHFTYYAAKSGVGQRVDSVRVFNDFGLNNSVQVGNFYRGGQSVSVHNSWSMLQLPVQVQLQLNGAAKHAWQISGAVVPGMLVGSNALYFNRSTGTYYKENDQYRKFQLAVQTGVSYTPWVFGTYQLSLGPVVQYGITNFTKPAAYTREHLFFAGLKTNIIIK